MEDEGGPGKIERGGRGPGLMCVKDKFSWWNLGRALKKSDFEEEERYVHFYQWKNTWSRRRSSPEGWL